MGGKWIRENLKAPSHLVSESQDQFHSSAFLNKLWRFGVRFCKTTGKFKIYRERLLALAIRSEPSVILLVFRKEHSLFFHVENHISEAGYLLGFHGI